MRIRFVPVFLAVALATGTLTAQTRQTAPVPAQISDSVGSGRIVYTFDQPALQPPHYTITLAENGMGRFVSVAGAPPADGSSEEVYPAPMDREIRVDPALLADLFRYARSHRYFNGDCNKHGHLAFTGNKTMTYLGPDGRGSCAFVWASDPELQQLSDRLNAVALTLEIGRRLDVEMHHYPLGLDAELESLENAVKEEQASDLPNIAPELQSIASDQDVMDRVRRRATALLNSCEDRPTSN